MEVPLLHLIPVGLAAEDAPEFGQVAAQVVGVRNVLEREPEELVAGVAEDLREARVDAEPRPVWPDVGDPDGGILERGSELLLALAEGVLSPLPVGHVGLDGHISGEPTVFGRSVPGRSVLDERACTRCGPTAGSRRGGG